VVCLFTAHNYFQTREVSLLTIEKHLLANSQKMLQEFLNNSKTATLVIDDQMKLLFRNKKATEIFQLTDENWSTILSREIIERASTYSSDQFNPTEGSNKSDERKSIASIVNQAEKLVDIKQARIVVSEGQTADQYVFVDIDYQRLFFEN
jgi:transcriptional regulator with PAS, ATPase and Fis domain